MAVPSTFRFGFLSVVFGLTAAAQAPPEPAAAPPPPLPQVLQNYKPITAERPPKPEDSDWAMVRRTYDGWGYSPLAQITPQNVQRLQPAWIFSTGMTSGHEAAPVVANGVMFVATPGSQVIALDAATGNFLWRFKRQLPEGSIIPHPTSRGVALYGDKVFLAAGDATLVAIDVKTGKEVGSKQVADNKSGYYMSLAPLAADGKIMVGCSGGEMGIRGFVSFFHSYSRYEF